MAAIAPGELRPGTSAYRQSCDIPVPTIAGNCKPQFYLKERTSTADSVTQSQDKIGMFKEQNRSQELNSR